MSSIFLQDMVDDIRQDTLPLNWTAFDLADFTTGALTMTLTKVKLIDSVRKQAHLPKNKSAQVVDSLLENIKKTLENGEDVLISGFGKFCVREKGKRRGRNPHTGEDLMLAERRVVVFKCSGVLRDKMNRA
jgi:integration host factor subunit alpha